MLGEVVPLLDWTGYRARVQVEGPWTPKEFQRWTARRKVELLLQLIRGKRKLEKYHTEQPHSALGYLTPKEFAEQLAA